AVSHDEKITLGRGHGAKQDRDCLVKLRLWRGIAGNITDPVTAQYHICHRFGGRAISAVIGTENIAAKEKPGQVPVAVDMEPACAHSPLNHFIPAVGVLPFVKYGLPYAEP